MNQISELKQIAIIELLTGQYCSIRELAEIFSISKGTARRYYNLYWDAVRELDGDGAVIKKCKGGYWYHRKHIEIQKKHINRRIK